MGEKRVRAGVAVAATQALKPLYDALGDLAVALDAVIQEDELRATAERRAQRILDDAHTRAAEVRAATEARIGELHAVVQGAWQAAREAGWTERQLTSPPLNLRLPAAAPRRRRRSPNSTTTPPEPAPTSGSDIPVPRMTGHPPASHGDPDRPVDDWR